MRGEVRSVWGKSHEELYELYSSNIVLVIKFRVLRWIGQNIQILVRKPEGKRLLGGPMHRWNDNINIDFKNIL